MVTGCVAAVGAAETNAGVGKVQQSWLDVCIMPTQTHQMDPEEAGEALPIGRRGCDHWDIPSFASRNASLG